MPALHSTVDSSLERFVSWVTQAAEGWALHHGASAWGLPPGEALCESLGQLSFPTLLKWDEHT